MTEQLSPTPIFKAFGNGGMPLTGGLLYTYAAGTTTPQATYQDSTGTPNTNPVVLNFRGEASVWLDPSLTYKLQLTDSLGNTIPGYPVDNIIGGFYLSQQVIGGYLYPLSGAESLASAVPVNFFYPWGTVDRYQTNTTPGTTNMTFGLQTALNVALQGCDVIFLPNANYFLGDVTLDGKTNPITTVTGLSDVVFYGNGATLTFNTTALVAGCGIQLVNPSNVVVRDLNATDTGFDQSQKGNPSLQGTAPFFLTNSGSVDSFGFTMENCSATNALMLCDVWRDDTSRLRGLQFINCRATNIYAGLAFEQQGDDVQIDNFVCVNPVRAYYPYGVINHRVNMSIVNDGTNANAGSTAACPIARRDFDTKDISLRLTYHGDTSIFGSLVGIEAIVTSAGPAVFDGIDIDLRLGDSTVSGSNIGYPLQFEDITGGSTVNPTGTQWNNITLRGDFGQWPAANINNPISILSAPTLTGGSGVLSLIGDQANVLMKGPQVYPGFLIKTNANTLVMSKSGDLTAAPFFIDLTEYTGLMFCLRINLTMEAEYDLSITSQAFREYLTLGFNSAGTVTISSTTTVQSIDVGGSPPVVTLTASGEGINVAITNYSNAKAVARMYVEHISKFV